MNILDFKKRKISKQKISMLTCYDYSFAKILASTPVDSLLVGDSAAMTMLGEKNTLNISIDLISHFVRAVSRGAPQKFIVADMTFLSFRKGLSVAMDSVEKLMQAGAHAVKIEGAEGNLDLIKHVTQSGVPVMGHLGLTPQSVHAIGGYRVQGREPAEFQKMQKEALQLQDAGCFSLVLECVPKNLGKSITQALEIPTIGIGAGPDTDGQVLVLQDMLGMNSDFTPHFLRKYLDGSSVLSEAFQQFHNDVVTQKFPTEKESYE